LNCGRQAHLARRQQVGRWVWSGRTSAHQPTRDWAQSGASGSVAGHGCSFPSYKWVAGCSLTRYWNVEKFFSPEHYGNIVRIRFSHLLKKFFNANHFRYIKSLILANSRLRPPKHFIVRMRPSTFVLLAGALTVVNAHFELAFPPPRGPFDDNNEVKFCGKVIGLSTTLVLIVGADNYVQAVSNRSEFPLSGGFFTLLSEHTSWTRTSDC
jgi:hypothetical protein